MKLSVNAMIRMAVLVCCLCAPQAWAAVFANEDLTASAAGVANAVVAGGDDVSAAIYNPAGLAWQSGLQILLGSQSNSRTADVTVNGGSFSADTALSDVSLFALSWMPQGSDWGVSTAMSTPFASTLNWGTAFAAAPQAVGLLDMTIKRYSLDAFWRVQSSLAVSLGADWHNSSIDLTQNAVSFSGAEQGGMALHAGLRWQVQPFWMLGMHLRQGATLDIQDGSARLAMQLPDEISLGIAHDMDDLLRLELDIKHSKWSAMKNLDVSSIGLGLTVDLQDTTDILLGATWFWRDNTQLRLGYAYEQGANTAASLQPALLDLTGHRISAGFGGMMSGMHLDVTYSWVIYNDSESAGAWAGTYHDEQRSFLFSLSKSF